MPGFTEDQLTQFELDFGESNLTQTLRRLIFPIALTDQQAILFGVILKNPRAQNLLVKAEADFYSGENYQKDIQALKDAKLIDVHENFSVSTQIIPQKLDIQPRRTLSSRAEYDAKLAKKDEENKALNAEVARLNDERAKTEEKHRAELANQQAVYLQHVSFHEQRAQKAERAADERVRAAEEAFSTKLTTERAQREDQYRAALATSKDAARSTAEEQVRFTYAQRELVFLGQLQAAEQRAKAAEERLAELQQQKFQAEKSRKRKRAEREENGDDDEDYFPPHQVKSTSTSSSSSSSSSTNSSHQQLAKRRKLSQPNPLSPQHSVGVTNPVVPPLLPLPLQPYANFHGFFPAVDNQQVMETAQRIVDRFNAQFNAAEAAAKLAP